MKQRQNKQALREQIRDATLAEEGEILRYLIGIADLSRDTRQKISKDAATLIREIRDAGDTGLMETFLAEYGLSTEEGIALMCLAEALLRVPDAETIDALIEDKIAPSDWGKHLGHSSSSLVNASTWALLLTGKVLAHDDEGMLGALRSVVKRLGEPVIRTAVSGAMREMGKQFVLGRDIAEAMDNAVQYEKQGFTYSYDMLGEAARTEEDAKRYHLFYSEAIGAIAKACTSEDIRENPGISVKLSALHPRYELQQRKRVMEELVPRTRSLALLAKSAGMGFNIDAEEADRLDLSLDVIEAVLADPSLKDWDGFGVVVQAYGQRTSFVLDWLYDLAERLDRRIMVRLVKGAYWDTEIKLAQTLGIEGFPVFTRKPSTDVSYIANARKLLRMTDRIYPQFATHNAHTVCSILELAQDNQSFEFQRLHGMGETLHSKVLGDNETRCRIYAPVGAHRDLLAYLVRRLLENGANSSFVNQIVDEDVAAKDIASDPFETVEEYIASSANPAIAKPAAIYGKERTNAKGWNLADAADVQEIENARTSFGKHPWEAVPLIASGSVSGTEKLTIVNPADHDETVGTVIEAGNEEVGLALSVAKTWEDETPEKRASTLRKAADLYEENFSELFALLSREAGKTLLDCIGELREAVDFLRYYGGEAVRLGNKDACGIFTCISPWNFPLAIFTGQIGAALAAGNGVIATPAETTPLIAYRAVQLLHEAGVPRDVLQLLPGKGSIVGAALTSDDRVGGVCFTGSTATARIINRSMAESINPAAPLIAETGGLNAMIVDSTALPEQAVRDILASAYQSAGQRCSALRVLYVQDDVAETVLNMLKGAMDELVVGNPWDLATDVGPVIDSVAKKKIFRHIQTAVDEGRLLHQLECPEQGTFIAPALLKVDSILDLEEEIFGPVLHVATFRADEIDQAIGDVNSTGYGLTFGLHTRIDDRVQHIVDHVEAGNIYVNRNQIGAIVGSQPFGGEGLSGTGPKAGGPNYVPRFVKVSASGNLQTKTKDKFADCSALQQEIDKAAAKFKPVLYDRADLPGPTGESNRLSRFPKGVVLCLGPDAESLEKQTELAKQLGCVPVSALQLPHYVEDCLPDPANLTQLNGFESVLCFGGDAYLRSVRNALSQRKGPIIPLITSPIAANMMLVERHVCVDITASGGNAALLAAQS
ncbi:MAG: bifunctional proline dehydrogenase/L-glutamate gamma-semialdehyde dehydrogenase PutA [Pseudomonadota bacterium]